MISDHYRVTIYNGRVSRQGPFIYALYAPTLRCVYIGQTFSAYGALGRLSQHLSDGAGNTFTQRICSVYEYQEVYIDHIDFAAVPLYERPEFTGDSRDYREAVEYLVQQAVIKLIRDKDMRIGVISRVWPNPYRSLTFVAEQAASTATCISLWLQEVASTTS